MVRPLLVALVLHAGSTAAESLHLAPIGTAVRGSFELGGKSIPLPAGKFVLAATTVTEPAMLEGDISKPRAKLARVLLVQVERPRLRAAVLASVALPPASYRLNWINHTCKKENVLYRADLASAKATDEDCLLVDHSLGNFGPRSQGVWKEAATWLTEQHVELPVAVLISAHVIRAERWRLVSAWYAFNPRMYGCDAPRSRSWAESPWNKKHLDGDPQRVRFVDSVTDWGKAVQQHFDQLVAGRPVVMEKAPAIHSCAAARASLD
ncbi:MAG TPA: hypothetical protein VGJ74_07280 [Burkholderiales bacterium]|jgi:hypothetical protein